MNSDSEQIIDLNELDTYLYNEISFSGKEILDWCNKNKNSEDFDYKYASKEIYNGYLKDKLLNLNNYYYILYGDCFIRDDIYYIKRDTVMSPEYDGRLLKYKDIKKLMNNLNNNIKEIISLATKMRYDINIMYNKLDVMSRRLSKLNIHNTDISKIRESFNNSSNYKRYQIYNIIKNTVLDLDTILTVIKNIKDNNN